MLNRNKQMAATSVFALLALAALPAPRLRAEPAKQPVQEAGRPRWEYGRLTIEATSQVQQDDLDSKKLMVVSYAVVRFESGDGKPLSAEHLEKGKGNSGPRLPAIPYQAFCRKIKGRDPAAEAPGDLAALNALGEQGWELVKAGDPKVEKSTNHESTRTILLFKRVRR